MSLILISQATFIKVIIESYNLLIYIFVDHLYLFNRIWNTYLNIDITHTNTHTHTHTHIYIYIYIILFFIELLIIIGNGYIYEYSKFDG